MDHIAAAQERLVNDRLRQKLNEVNSAVKSQLSGVQDHVNFTLQQAYYKCAYECFDRTKKQDEITNCVEHCSVPMLTAQNLVETEMGKFQERLNRSLRVCQDKYESSKIQPNSNNAMQDLESCVEVSIQDSIDLLPHVARKLKTQMPHKD